MMFDLQSLISYSAAYLFILFFCAWATEKELIPPPLVQHPFFYVLSLGVYASSWVYYGSIEVADDNGYIFLAFYFGLTGAFFLAPILLHPILKIIHNYQLGSLADLFAFRFQSPLAGKLSTILLLVAVMPLLALQIQTVANSIHLISKESSPEVLAIGFCIAVILFTIFFGSRHISSNEHHQGLVFAIAVESLLKLIVMLVLGAVALLHVFGGLDALNHWLAENKHSISGINSDFEIGPWRTTLLMFFASAIVMPHMFHMTFTENRDKNSLDVASWGLPLFLLLLSISTPIISWSATKLGIITSPQYFSLAIGQAINMPWLTMIVFLSGLSATSGMMIVTTLALSSMVLNHIVLPLYHNNNHNDLNINIYRRLIWLKRIIIFSVIITAYIFYLYLDGQQNLYSLGLISYIGAIQLLPGVLYSIYCEKANSKGFVYGLIAGTFIWLTCLVIPLSLHHTTIFNLPLPINSFILEKWYWTAIASLIVNSGIFYIVSSSSNMNESEVQIAQACMIQNIKVGIHSVPKAESAIEFKEMLSPPLGKNAAHKEVNKALLELNMQPNEKRSHALARLRATIETNLSGLMGPSIANEIIKKYLPLRSNKNDTRQDVHFIEKRLEAYHSQLTGLASELDDLRRYHRDTLNSIPVGVCTIGNNDDIILWNNAIDKLTNITALDAIGMPISQLPEPWATLFFQFMESHSDYQINYCLTVHNNPRWFNLHKARINAGIPHLTGNQVVLIEDMTDNHMLEEQLIHSERLASIGQLAAGVAHEIGNPITGIDCLAQELKALSPDPSLQDTAKQILTQTKRVSNIVQMLVSYAHTGQSNHQEGQHSIENVAVYSCVMEAINLLKLNRKNDSLTFQNKCNQDHKVKASYQKLQQVFINLLNNAADASTLKGKIIVSSLKIKDTINIEVEDQGHGIPQSIQDKLFDPFFTTKEAGKGTGLGLALTWNIIEEYFGTIRVISPANKDKNNGTRFIISLPYIE